MIRRIIWLLIILGLTYGIYRAIDPVGAADLVARIQSYFDNEDDIEEVVEEQEPEEVIIEQERTGKLVTAPIYTGTINTGSLVELDYVLSGSTPSSQTGASTTSTSNTQTKTPAPTPITPTTSTTTPTPKSTPKKSLSKQDEADMKAFLNAIVE